ncbi:MAG TPA: HAD family hydrolase [Pseudolysinimonas sp.]|nr:HAD family hydrolase [Pseudolysinimonas sp.]
MTAAAGGGIRVALFDLDDTLFAHREAVDRGLAAHRAALGGAIADADDEAESVRWHELEELHYHRYLSGELDFRGQRRARARSFVSPFGEVLVTDSEAEAWFDSYLVHYENNWGLHDDTLPCLDALTTGHDPVRIGLITNGDLRSQTAKLRSTDLLPRIEHIVASGSVGVAKPDAAIFAHACDVFGVAPGEAAYIGDRLATDALGASAAGLLGVWLDRPGLATDEQLETARAAGVPVIRSLAQVPGLLGR